MFSFNKVSNCQCCESAAVYRCLTCEMFICENCSDWHNKWPDHKKHTVLSINELNSPEGQTKMKSKLYCRKHQDKTLKFYCETCKVNGFAMVVSIFLHGFPLVCLLNVLTGTELYSLYGFNTHQTKSFMCVSGGSRWETKRNIKINCATLGEKLSEGKKALDNISGVMKSLEENATAVKDKVKQQKENVVKTVIDKLDERAKKMFEEVDEIYGELHAELTKQYDEIKQYIDKVQGNYLSGKAKCL